MSATATLLPDTRDQDVPLTGRWLNPLCGCCNGHCGPGGLAFCVFFNYIAALTCVPCLIGQIAGRASWRSNICGQHQEPLNNASTGQSNCMRAWLNSFLLVIIPTVYGGIWFLFRPTGHDRYLVPDGYYMNYTRDYHSRSYIDLGVSGFAPIVLIVFMVLTIVFNTNFRFWMRQRYQIPADCCCDCCVMSFCFPCAINQMYSHVYAGKTGCGICSDPGPHPDTPSQGMMGGSTEKEIFVTAAEQQPVMVTAMAQPVMVMAQPVEESTQQYPQLYPQPVVVATTTTS